MISNISGDLTRKLEKLPSFTATFGVLCESHSCITLPEFIIIVLLYFGCSIGSGLLSCMELRSYKTCHQVLLFTFFIKPFLALVTKSPTVPCCTALAVLFPDYQNLTYVKQQNVALPLSLMFLWKLIGAMCLMWVFHEGK